MASCLSNQSNPLFRILLLGLGVGATLCACKQQTASTDSTHPTVSASVALQASASARPKPVRIPRAKGTVPKAEAVALTTRDGVKLSAWFYAGGDERAPAVIMAHRMGGTNEEWKPLLERLFPVNQKMNVLTMDMRGHGESSKKQGDNKKTSWTVFDQKDFVAMAKDVEAAIGWFNKRPAGAPSSIILVGSDIGATSSVIAAGSAGKQLAAVAIISPGAALRGVDLYKPFGAITGLPNLVIGGQKDNVAEEPLRALPAMSKTTQVHTYDSSMHGAEYLGNDKPESWDDVADWIDARARAVGVTPAASASSETSIPKPEASAQ